jgi:transcription elongation factor Elf1
MKVQSDQQLEKQGGCPVCHSRKIKFDTKKKLLVCEFCGHAWPEDQQRGKTGDSDAS